MEIWCAVLEKRPFEIKRNMLAHTHLDLRLIQKNRIFFLVLFFTSKTQTSFTWLFVRSLPSVSLWRYCTDKQTYFHIPHHFFHINPDARVYFHFRNISRFLLSLLFLLNLYLSVIIIINIKRNEFVLNQFYVLRCLLNSHCFSHFLKYLFSSNLQDVV